MDRPSVYIETSIVSYLAARPSRDPISLRNQQLTHAWWNTRRERYTLFTSGLTWAEAALGNPATARRRLELLSGILTVPALLPVAELARKLHRGIPLPPQAEADAEHIAVATVSGSDYLLTWDRKHIANPHLRPRIQVISKLCGYTPPVACTPEDLMR